MPFTPTWSGEWGFFALAFRADSFCTFDKNQAKLAAALGLRIP